MRQLSLVILTIIILLVTLQGAFADTGFTVGTNMLFTGTSSDPSTFYQDGVGGAFGNSDVGIELCAVGQRYVGAFYAMNIASSWSSALVTYSSSTNALALTTVDVGGGCYEANPGFVTVSPSYLTTPSPFVYRAALPGRLYIGYALSANPGTVSDYIYASSNAVFSGSYTISRTFDQASRDIAVSTPQIAFTSTSGTFSKSATDGTFGVSDERRMALGVCDDDHGESCSDGGILTTATFPQTFASGLTAGQVNDQNTYTKYVVANGLGYSMCIGANLDTSISSPSPNPVYYGQTLNYTINLLNPRNTPYELNGGNVEVTTSFDVDIRIYEQANSSNLVYTNSFTAAGNLAPGGSFPVDLDWPALAHSGTYVIEATIDANDDIVECDEGDNVASTTFVLLPVTLPQIFIDDVNTTEFERPNVPYRLDISLMNSDGDILNNSQVVIIEENGLNLAAPTQRYNRSIGPNASTDFVEDAIISQTKVLFTTDYDGNASFTFMPTHNALYDAYYADYNLSAYAGNYSLVLLGNESSGLAFKFVLNGSLYSEYPLTVANLGYNGTYPYKTIYHETVTAQILDFAYHAYVNFLDTIVN